MKSVRKVIGAVLEVVLPAIFGFVFAISGLLLGCTIGSLLSPVWDGTGAFVIFWIMGAVGGVLGGLNVLK